VSAYSAAPNPLRYRLLAVHAGLNPRHVARLGDAVLASTFSRSPLPAGCVTSWSDPPCWRKLLSHASLPFASLFTLPFWAAKFVEVTRDPKNDVIEACRAHCAGLQRPIPPWEQRLPKKHILRSIYPTHPGKKLSFDPPNLLVLNCFRLRDLYFFDWLSKYCAGRLMASSSV